MKANRPILQSKLTSPYTTHTLRRPRLEEQLKAIAHKKLALIIAGAGYGKSTLAAQTVSDLDADSIWYNLDESDGDLPTFMAHLLAGIQRHKPEFGVDLRPKLAAPLTSKEHRRKLLTSFICEVERRLLRQMVIVLDDYYLIQENPEILDAIEFLLGRMPKTFHWVIVSRMEPGLKLSRYRATTDIIELGEEDLAFNCNEINRLYRELLDVRIDPSQADTLYAKTGGWAAALLLFFNAIKGCPSTEAVDGLFEIDKPRKFIFEYLEENLIENLPGEIQDFMMRSSLLTQLDSEICNEVCDTSKSHEILSRLSRNHLLTFPRDASGDCYQYHLLLKDFLRNRLARQYGQPTVRELHRHIAKTMEKRGDIQGALHHYVAGEHFDEACGLLSGLSLIDFKDIPITFLKQVFDRISPALIAKNARVLIVRAKIMSVGGEIRKAIHDFQIALELFKEEDDADGIASCRKEIGFHHYLTGSLAKAIEALAALWDHPHKDPFFPLEVGGLLILLCAIMGDMEASDEYYDAAMKKFAVSDIFDAALIRAWFSLCHAFRFHLSGNFRKADFMNQQALETFRDMKLDNFLPITYLQTALTAYYLIEYRQGCDYVQKGLAMAEKQGVHDSQYAWLFHARALNRLGVGLADQARSDAEAALDLFAAYENAWGQAMAHECLGMIHGSKGEWEKAAAACENGLVILNSSEMKKAPAQAALVLGLAEALLNNGQLQRAVRVLDGCPENIRILQFELFRLHLLRAGIENGNAATDRAIGELETALAIAEENGYEKWIKPERPWLLPLLVACHHRNKFRELIERVFIDADREADIALFMLRNNGAADLRHATDRLLKAMPHKVPAPLRIRCLGSFSVAIGEQLIPGRKWRSAKASILFKYLAVHYEQGWIPKETLLELAWPGEDPAVTTPRLHVALNTLRKLFEPDLKRGMPSAYIVRNSDGYRLEIGKDGSIDYLTFAKVVDEAAVIDESRSDQALALGLKAISLYRGSLLEEDPYDEWLTQERESLRMKYLQYLDSMIRQFEKQGAWHRCIELGETYLMHDEYAEPIYRKLMGLYARVGNLPRVTQTFERCKSSINDGLDCPLSDITLNLYDKIINGNYTS